VPDLKREPKNIVICCDGTGNEFGAANSNVVKIYTCLTVDKNQISYYHPGVGTMGNPNKTSRWGKESSRIAGLVFAEGFTANLSDAYRYLMNHYEDDDRIYLFGFSRGAYTVRALAGALHMYGLLCPGNEGHLAYLLQMFSEESRRAYKRGKLQGGRKIHETDESKAFRETFSRVVPIYFVGIWDTVSSIGWIYDPVKLLFDGQNPIMRKGRHAISVDERRCFYQANLWGPALPMKDTPILKEYNGDTNSRQDIVQVWFPGAHSDVGGSYPQTESGPAMEALRWILEEAEADKLQIHAEKRDAIFGLKPAVFPDLNKLNVPAKPPTNCVHHSLTWKWWPLELFPHKYFDENGDLRWQLLPWPHRREVPDGALLHPSLRSRLANDPTYRPKNLNPANIKDYSQSPVPLPNTDAMDQLAEKNFGVYRPGDTSTKRLVAGIGVAALFWIGMTALLIHKGVVGLTRESP
jgi:uncharacterized protein (DUF2235 family)